LVDEALDHVQETGQRSGEAGLYMLRGWLLLALSGRNVTEAEGCFQQALAIARRQSSKLWELRVTASLARLWQRQGKKAEARQMLAEIYGWFTEGFDTKDLQAAKALLEELNH
jgi:predicted ATPase